MSKLHNLNEHRIIFFTGEIDMNSMKDLKEQILEYELDGDAPIIIFIDSPGGIILAVEGAMDLIKICESPIYLVGNGYIASAGGYLLTCGGKKGYRFMTPNSKYMIHQPSYSNLGSANVENLKEYYDSLNQQYLTLFERYKSASKITKKKLEELFAGQGSTISAQEALEYGFIDGILNDISELI